MTLPSDKNHMATTFTDAYWAIVQLSYDFNTLTFRLGCYPSRDAKQLNSKKVENPSIENYGSCEPTYKPELYSWTQILFIADVFPEGIPLGRDAQLSQIYSFIKEYTGLPFEDVFEEKEEAAEPIVEPVQNEPTVESVADPEPEIPAEELYVEPIQEANTDTDEPQVEAEREEIENGIN